MKTKYVTNKNGKATSVILSIRQYKKLRDAYEELEDIRLYDKVKAKGEKVEDGITLDEYIQERKKGNVPNYTIVVLPTARKQLDNLPDSIANLLTDEIGKLAANPRPFGCKKLKGRNSYRIRKGDYRILYEIADNILKLYVVAVGHRREIYR